MDAREREQLVAEILARLEERGTPQGTWLVEIAQVRASLAAADEILRRMANAVIRDAEGPARLPS